MVEEQIVKSSGEPWFELSLRRDFSGKQKANVGLVLHVTADPAIETFMRQISNDVKTEAVNYGPVWINLGNGNLEVYHFRNNTIPQTSTYTLNSVGHPLLINGRLLDGEPDGGAGLVNLALLRIVGISKPGGVRFGITGACSKTYAINLSNQLIAETKRFIEDHITPISINLRIVQARG